MGASCIGSRSVHDGYVANSDIEPNPRLFNIIKWKSRGNFSLVKINYPNCTNYEGMKICLYNYHISKVLETKLLDPHFSEKGISPFARFEPTTEGWNAGLKMLQFL
jgi:hypothetical protein